MIVHVEVWSAVLALGVMFIFGYIVASIVQMKVEEDSFVDELRASVLASKKLANDSVLEHESHAEIMVTLKSIALLLAQYKMINTEIIAGLEAQVVQSNIASPERDPTVEQMKREGLAKLQDCFSRTVYNRLTRAARIDDDPLASDHQREGVQGLPRIWCFEDIAKYTPRELMDIPRFGEIALRQVRNALGRMDLTLMGETAESSPDYRSE